MTEIEVDESAPLRVQLLQAYLVTFEEAGVWMFAAVGMAATVALVAGVPFGSAYVVYHMALSVFPGTGPVATGGAWVTAILTFVVVLTVFGSLAIALVRLLGDVDDE